MIRLLVPGAEIVAENLEPTAQHRIQRADPLGLCDPRAPKTAPVRGSSGGRAVKNTAYLRFGDKFAPTWPEFARAAKSRGLDEDALADRLTALGCENARKLSRQLLAGRHPSGDRKHDDDYIPTKAVVDLYTSWVSRIEQRADNRCSECHTPIAGRADRAFCSDKCRKRAARARDVDVERRANNQRPPATAVDPDTRSPSTPHTKPVDHPPHGTRRSRK